MNRNVPEFVEPTVTLYVDDETDLDDLYQAQVVDQDDCGPNSSCPCADTVFYFLDLRSVQLDILVETRTGIVRLNSRPTISGYYGKSG